MADQQLPPPVDAAQHHREALHNALNDLSNGGWDLSDHIELLGDLLNGWLRESIGFVDEPLDPERKYTIRANQVDTVFATTRLMHQLARVVEGYKRVEKDGISPA